MKKTTQLKNLIYSRKLEFLMEAHNGLSAKIVEEAGFNGIWASGLAISATMGVRDNNEASWTQVLDVVEFMSDITSIPILLDGDTGYGNFNNARRLVKKLEQRQIAGVCIEDKLFPKTNSFIGGEKQPLADINEFCGKIKAMKDSQTDDDFIVVSRVEAFIAGWGLREALRRAEAYRQAGTDAILIHSKIANISEIEAFMKEWNGRLPVIIVPTKYYSVPTEKFIELGVSVAIWANHNLRATIGAMKETSNTIFQDKSIINIEEKLVSLNEVFRLQGTQELEEAENKYLPSKGKELNAIILASNQNALLEISENFSNNCWDLNGKSILTMQIDIFNNIGIKDICIVKNISENNLTNNLQIINNEDFEHTKDLYSLYLASDKLIGNTIICNGDIIFKNYILNDLVDDSNDITLIVDADIDLSSKNKNYVISKEPYSKRLYFKTVEFVKMSSDCNVSKINGEFIGIWKVTKRGASIVKDTLQYLSKRNDFKKLTLLDLFNHISTIHPIAVRYIKGSWLDIDTALDLQKAGEINC